MGKNKYFWVGIFGGIVVIFAIAAVIKDGSMGTGQVGDKDGAVSASLGEDSINSSTDSGSPVGSPSNDDRQVTSQSGSYSFTVPVNWYVEKTGGDAMAIYPDYNPAADSSSSPDCKIELSLLSGKASSQAELNGWITQYLHTDPTADVSEISRNNFQSGGVSGIEWRGLLNGVTTTLAYLPVRAFSGGKIVEIAPSIILSVGEPDGNDSEFKGSDCELDFQALLANIQIKN